MFQKYCMSLARSTRRKAKKVFFFSVDSICQYPKKEEEAWGNNDAASESSCKLFLPREGANLQEKNVGETFFFYLV